MKSKVKTCNVPAEKVRLGSYVLQANDEFWRVIGHARDYKDKTVKLVLRDTQGNELTEIVFFGTQVEIGIPNETSNTPNETKINAGKLQKGILRDDRG